MYDPLSSIPSLKNRCPPLIHLPLTIPITNLVTLVAAAASHHSDICRCKNSVSFFCGRPVNSWPVYNKSTMSFSPPRFRTFGIAHVIKHTEREIRKNTNCFSTLANCRCYKCTILLIPTIKSRHDTGNTSDLIYWSVLNFFFTRSRF